MLTSVDQFGLVRSFVGDDVAVGVADNADVVGAEKLGDRAWIRVDHRIPWGHLRLSVELVGDEGKNVVFAQVQVLGSVGHSGFGAGVAVPAAVAGSVVDPMGLQPPSTGSTDQQSDQGVYAGAAVLWCGDGVDAWAAM